MPRILCIDYGTQRCGIAVTDDAQLIATALGMVPAKELIYFLKQYFLQNQVSKVVIGYPLSLSGEATDATPAVDKFLRNFKQVFPEKEIQTLDERFSSSRASTQIAQMNLSKKKREVKGLIDEVAATMLLQDYLETHAAKQ